MTCTCKPLVVCTTCRDKLGGGLRKRLQAHYHTKGRSIAHQNRYLTVWLEARAVLDRVEAQCR